MREFKDLQEWIEKARGIGELKDIKGADLNIEMGDMVQVNAKNEGPALLFSKFKGYDEKFRVFTNPMANIRLFNLTFGLPIENSIPETIQTLKVKAGEWALKAKDFPAKVVNSGAILENVVEGDQIDLEKFPVPLWHKLDGGRYIGTMDSIITRDPDSGEVNMGTYRVQLHDNRTVGFYISPGKHGRMHRDKYFQRGQPCPVVMLFGLNPLMYALSASEVPAGIFELDYLGAIRGESVPVIEGRATGLPIPADAEIAVEGFAYPDQARVEGPFGEWTGYYGSSSREEPFLRPSTLYYRNEPILCGAPPAKGAYAPYSFFRSVWRSAILHNEIEKSGIPNVKGVWLPPFGGQRLFIVVSIKQSYPGHAAEVGHIASQTRAGAYLGRYVVVVDDDINVYDIADVMWAVCTRSDPKEMDIIKRAWSGPLDPMIQKPTTDYHNSRGIIYAVKPYEWFDKFPPLATASKEARERVFSKWAKEFNGRWKDI